MQRQFAAAVAAAVVAAAVAVAVAAAAAARGPREAHAHNVINIIGGYLPPGVPRAVCLACRDSLARAIAACVCVCVYALQQLSAAADALRLLAACWKTITL